MFVKIAVPRPLDTLFDYEYSIEDFPALKQGDLVKVPFGKTSALGCVVEEGYEKPTDASFKIKKIQKQLDTQFSIPEEIFQLCKFGSEYYQYPLGEALLAAYPASPEKILSTRKKNKRDIEISVAEKKLNAEQQRCIEEIRNFSKEKNDTIFLLEGVTGSGKTEVYIEAAKEVIASGKSVLILVPEIALTSQLKDRFQSSLGNEIILWHSALSDGLRQTQWCKAKNGEVKVIVGARSAVFAPLKQLGLIVIDEEHDSTYKQEERFRYQARDLAIYRAKLAKCPVILGSATPSIESIQRIRDGKGIHLRLTKRFSSRPLPQIKTVSLLEESLIFNSKVKTIFAEKTIRELQGVIDRGEQAMVYFNRRGYSQFILCKDCGWIKKCDSCSISMTHYQQKSELRCHLCGTKARVPDICEQCHSHELECMGSGTEALESELKILLNDAKILRLDRDMITSQTRLEKTMDDFRALKANIMIGTQMLVKGHDFPKVTCVVVMLADMLLKWPDFRASERALQTLIQVAGRAGRAELPGQVLIQGYDLEHPVIKILKGEVTQEEFTQQELDLRRTLLYPPFSRFVRFRFEDNHAPALKAKVERIVQHLRKELNDEQHERVLGPSEAILFKMKNKYRYDAYFKAKTVDELFKVSQRVKKMALLEELQLTVDVDPYSA